MNKDDNEKVILMHVLRELDKKCLSQTYHNIGKELGITRQYAHLRFAKYMPKHSKQSSIGLVEELKEKDVSGLTCKEIYEIYGGKYQLSHGAVRYRLNCYEIPYRHLCVKTVELISIIKSVYKIGMTVPEIMHLLPTHIKKDTAQNYLYSADFRNKHGLILKSMRKTASW